MFESVEAEWHFRSLEDNSFGKRVLRDSTDMVTGKYVVLRNSIFIQDDSYEINFNSRGYCS